MNLDDYIATAALSGSDPAVAELISLLRDWKNDASDVTVLANRIERHFIERFQQANETHDNLRDRWLQFKREVIDYIGGQTVNERLYSFGLFERFDSRTDDDHINVLYAKLLARRFQPVPKT